MTTWKFQSAMSRGELDPLLVGRIDTQMYYNGLRTASEVLTIPQGGVKRRPGTAFAESFADRGRLEPFSFSTEEEFLFFFSAFKLEIYQVVNGFPNKRTNINGSGDDFLVTPFAIDVIISEDRKFDYIQSANTAIITYAGFPQRIFRGATNQDWTIENLPLTNIPQYDFDDVDSPTPVSEVQQILFTNQNEGDRYKISLEGILTEEIAFAGDDATNSENIRQALQELSNTSNEGITVGIFTAGTTWRVTFADSSADDWKLMTVVAILTEDVTFSGAVTEITPGTSRAEDVWSAGRGYPTVCTFHEARLWLGNSEPLPSTIWGSNVNDFYNFDEGRGRDDQAIFATLDTDQVNAIRALYSNRSLQVFTSGAEFYVKESPITPGNIAVLPQTNLGSKKVRPVTIDGVTLFVQRTGKSVNQFVFINEFQSNTTTSVTMLSPHLIKDPKELAIKRGSSSSDANYVYILNDDGTLTVFNTLSAEEVQAFTSWTTGDNIFSIAVVDDTLFQLVERTVGGTSYYYLEFEQGSITGDLNTDSAKYDAVDSGNHKVTGLAHLEGLTVDAKADGYYAGEFVVTGGEIQLLNAYTNAEVGIKYTPVIQTMPLNMGLENGPNAASKKKILRTAITMHESNGIIVNNQRLADKTIGVNQFDPPIPQTGLKRITLLGWSLEADITITQTTPFAMTILSIGIEVKT